MTPWEGLAKFFQNDYSVEQYVRIYDEAKARNAAIWPPYNQLKEVKKLCTPPNISVFGEEVICPMQSYLDHQSFWLLDDPFLLQDVKRYTLDPSVKIVLYTKDGMDGAGDQRVERWGNHPGSILSTFACPLELHAVKGSEYAVLWSNPRANSPTGHSYLRIAFQKEHKGTYFCFLLSPLESSVRFSASNSSDNAIAILVIIAAFSVALISPCISSEKKL